MTAPASIICCHGCGYVADPADPYPFRCPRAGTDDTDHVLTRVLRPAWARCPAPPPPPPPDRTVRHGKGISYLESLTFGSAGT
jgi:hypothetical protein